MKKQIILKIDRFDTFIDDFNDFVEKNGSIIGIVFLSIISILLITN